MGSQGIDVQVGGEVSLALHRDGTKKTLYSNAAKRHDDTSSAANLRDIKLCWPAKKSNVETVIRPMQAPITPACTFQLSDLPPASRCLVRITICG
jgi:hypothetical protein